MKELFCFFCIVHILCDFYFQSQTMADKKRKNISWVLLDIVVYTISALIMFRIILTGLSWDYCMLFVVSHALIDGLKYGICNSKFIKQKNIKFNHTVIFVIDQFFHILIIGFIVYGVKDMMTKELYNKDVVEFLNEIQIQKTLLISWILKLILIHKPSNILISSILKGYRPNEKYEDIEKNEDKNAGRFIGTLERIMMTILISIDQYSAVGLVLTAKSIARYDKISKDQIFAEYYLLGTLLSAICSIVVAILI